MTNQNDKKRKLQAQDDTTVLILAERWNIDRLSHIGELVLDASTEIHLSTVAKDFHRTGVTRRMVKYSAREFQQGRVYGQGLQGTSGWISRI